MRGYNILTSKNTVDDENPTWYPITVPDVWEYIVQMDCKGTMLPLQEPAILVITGALKDIDDAQLIGQVFIEENNKHKLQQRLFLYHVHYHFDDEHHKFDYDYVAKRVILRNYACVAETIPHTLRTYRNIIRIKSWKVSKIWNN